MKKILFFIFAWLVSTGVYVVLNITMSTQFKQFDLFEAGYFFISILPSAFSYRSASYKHLDWLIGNREIDSSNFQIRILGTLSPLFLGKLFFGSVACNKQKDRNVLRITFIMAILLWMGSVMVITGLDVRK
jgi:hypothetical protein